MISGGVNELENKYKIKPIKVAYLNRLIKFINLYQSWSRKEIYYPRMMCLVDN